MTEEKQSKTSAGEAWQDVGRHFEALGHSLAAAFQSTWENKEAQAQWANVKAEMEATADKIGQAATATADTDEAQKAKAEAQKMAASAHEAGKEMLGDARPHLLVAFRKIRTELDQIIEGMEQKETGDTPSTDTEPSESGE